jgi:predicted porin
MNKKLLAIAVAGALAAPGFAFAQASSVTISGMFKVGFEGLKYSNEDAPVTRLNGTQSRVVDNSSRIIFNSVEDLGGGTSAIAQLDVRFAPDQASTIQTSNPIGSGNSWVGLKSNAWGMVRLGRLDLHYGKAPSDLTNRAGALQAATTSLFDFIGGQPIANASRTQNVIKYDSPNWSGFTVGAAWSANPVGNSEQDMLNTAPLAVQSAIVPGAAPGVAAVVPLVAGTTPGGTNTNRDGNGYTINPEYTSGPFQIGYSYWNAKPDAPTAGTNDQIGHSLYGYWKFGGLKVGLGWNRSELENSNSGVRVAERDAWSIPVAYTMGPHSFYGHYTQAQNVKSDIVVVNNLNVDNTGAKMFAFAYEYALSKRTSLGLTYAQIRNDDNIAYNFFTSAALGSTDAVPTNGTKLQLLQATVFHAF